MKTKYTLLALILIFAALIRIYKITTLPPSLYYDELDAGYQALIFNQNQTDYYGNKLPIHFHSFGDYRTSLNIYAIAIFERITQNPEISVRLPSAVFGILSVLIIYLITDSLFAGFLLAISPWSIHYSRIGFEASGMILSLLLGILFWKKYLTKKQFIYVFLSTLFFGLSPYFYSTAKLFSIIIFLLITFIWSKEFIRLGFKKIFLLLIFGLLIISPMIIDTLNGKSGFRFSYISIFTEPHREQTTDNLRYQDVLVDHPNEIGVSTSLISKIFHNKYQLILQKFVTNYISSFSPIFLFLEGDSNPRHGFAGWGILYLVDFILVAIGIFSAFSNKQNHKFSYFFFLLLIFAPIPFSLTRDSESPHATRLILMLPSIIYFASLGFKYLRSKYRFSSIITIAIYILCFLSFWHFYYYHYPQNSAMAWNTGMKEAVTATNSYSNRPLVFSDKYISFVSFFLFYRPYLLKPSDSISNHLVQYGNHSFDGQILDNIYYFGHINWTNTNEFPTNTIFILPISEYNSNSLSSYKILSKIDKKYINQEEFIIISKI